VVAESERARLRWACRRGLRELDLLLSAFLEVGFADLDGPDQERFIQLLALPDQELIEWLLGQAIPVDRDIARVVESVRRAYTP
jgi:antitoxin CptB